ncbi:unnamed protein product [Sympodiomycopsis kandeliae]
MPSIEVLPADTPTGTNTTTTTDSKFVAEDPSFDRGGISDELAEKLIKAKLEGNNGPSTSGENSWLPGKSGKSFEEALASFDQVPLFMKELPTDEDASASGSSRDQLEALRSLAFEGTPDEVAINFKNYGNEYFKSKRYKEAIGFYTQAIDSDPNDTQLKLSLHLNRSACNLELYNYRSCLQDTAAALSLDTRSLKAFFRAAKALAALGKFVEAIDCCDHGLEIERDNQEFKNLKQTITANAVRNEKRIQENKVREKRQKELNTAFQQAFVSRGLWIETSPNPPDNPSAPSFDETNVATHNLTSYPLSSSSPPYSPPDPIRTPLNFPTLLLYPQHTQSDFIQSYHEDISIGSQLDVVFPNESRGSIPWDSNQEYYSSNLQVYATTKKMRLLKIPRGLSLREIIDHAAKEEQVVINGGKKLVRDGIVLKDGIITLVVLPKKSKAEQEWVDKFKKDRENAKQRGLLD